MLRTLRPLWPYLWRYRRAFLLGLVALALKDLAAVAAPLIIRGAVDRFSQGAPAAQIWKFAGYLVAAAVLRGIFQYWMRVVLIGISRDIEYDLRNDLFGAWSASPPISTRATARATSWPARPTI
jgi:ATP-binding cassette subfamily B multidrug efflux pump